MPRKLRAAPANAPRLVRAIRTEPVETLLYIPEQFSHWAHRPVPYEVEDNWGYSLHEMLGLPWPCPEVPIFEELWDCLLKELVAKGLAVGRWTSGTYSDADPALAACVWCAVRHFRPTNVVETGVARGLTSRVILEAMAANGTGHLSSVDLPDPFGGAELESQTGAAVSDQLRANWTYLRGSSRRKLRQLVRDVGTIDMFVHDSLHTVRNMRFEMETVWPALRNGGFLIVDDVDKAAFRDFVQRTDRQESRVHRSADGPWMWGIIRKVEM